MHELLFYCAILLLLLQSVNTIGIVGGMHNNLWENKMKKTTFTFFALMVLFFASCSQDSDSSGNESSSQGNTNGGGYTLSFDVNEPESTDEKYYWSMSFKYTEEIPGSNFNPNFNGQVPKPVSCTADTKITLPVLARTYVKSDSSTGHIIDYNQDDENAYTYWFVGWNTKKDASGTSYSAGDKITISENLTLYAVYMKKDGTLPGSSSDASDNTNILDMYKTKSFSMKVGESVTLKASWSAGDNCTYSITEDDYGAVELSGNVLTAKTVGTAIVTMTSNENPLRAGDCTITVTSDDFSGNGNEYRLLGTWKSTKSGNKSYIIFNADKTGEMKVYINNSLVQDATFNWYCYTNLSILVIENSTSSYINKNYGITFQKTSTPIFSLDGYLAFGMPHTTEWIKQ